MAEVDREAEVEGEIEVASGDGEVEEVSRVAMSHSCIWEYNAKKLEMTRARLRQLGLQHIHCRQICT